MTSSSIKYRLPRTELVVSGTVRSQVDALEVSEPKSVLSAIEVSVVTEADAASEISVTPPRGLFKTYKGSFSVTTDGRLSSASSDVTGELGTVLKSVASIAGAAVGVFALSSDEAIDDFDNLKITDAYAAVHGKISTRLKEMRTQRAQAQSRFLDALCSAESDPADLRRLRQRVAMLDEQLVPLVAHFRIWRQSQITTTDVPFEFRHGLGDIPTVEPQLPKDSESSTHPTPVDLASLWTNYGYAVQAHWLDTSTHTRATHQNQAPSKRESDTVYARRPERLELRVHQKLDEAVVCIKRSRHSVADARSEESAYKLEKSWFGRRSISLTFDTNGFVTTVGTEGTSGAAAALASLAGLPEGFAGGVENATKAYSNVQAAGRASIEAETARVKAEVEGRQQRLLGAGLDATAADAVELQRLQQLQGVLESQIAIRGTDPSLVASLAQRAEGDLDWYRPPVPPGQAEPQVIRVILGEQTTAEQAVAEPPTQPTPPALGG